MAVCLRGLFSLQLIHHLLEKDVVVVSLVIRVAGFKKTVHYPEQSGISEPFAQHNHMWMCCVLSNRVSHFSLLWPSKPFLFSNVPYNSHTHSLVSCGISGPIVTIHFAYHYTPSISTAFTVSRTLSLLSHQLPWVKCIILHLPIFPSVLFCVSPNCFFFPFLGLNFIAARNTKSQQWLYVYPALPVS